MVSRWFYFVARIVTSSASDSRRQCFLKTVQVSVGACGGKVREKGIEGEETPHPSLPAQQCSLAVARAARASVSPSPPPAAFALA
ncbi:hypothetical protein E2C01_002481 [Portunus trituberculatus]|uniref:Uncharacterized protein n=1 Tax=Portunus trituberculatus TaxID=210409 RepID=A0A5B7CMD6_PORTR|nr:hypothetical protein [Portunus trituberculatus]